MSVKLVKIRNILLFLLSMLMTVSIGFVIILSIFTKNDDVSPVFNENRLKSVTKILFSDISDNVSYEIDFDYEKGKVKVLLLEFDNSVYDGTGLSGLRRAAEDKFYDFTKVIAVTSTQFAALIDHIGGVPVNVDSYNSDRLGIDKGYSMISGITAVEYFKDYRKNRVVCLEMMKNIAESWYSVLKDKRDFFKLLNLSDNDISYTEYLKVQKYFKKKK